MIKHVVLLKKRPDMTDEAFRDYYENHHSKLIRFMPEAKRYVRRYVVPRPIAAHIQNPPPLDVDVITEVWFETIEDYNSARARVDNPEVGKLFAEDEENLFDRTMIRSFLVEEVDSVLPPAK